jgi:hypothetical protein
MMSGSSSSTGFPNNAVLSLYIRLSGTFKGDIAAYPNRLYEYAAISPKDNYSVFFTVELILSIRILMN